MKKGIVGFIAMVGLIVSSHGQQISVKLNSYYFFKHPAQYSTVDALNKNLETSLGGINDKVSVLVFDEANMNIHLKTELNGNSGISKIDEIINLGPKTVMYLTTGEKGDPYSYIVFENQPDEMMVLCIWRNDIFEIEGWLGY